LYCQAEDGIRDRNVTGVQTCALPISDTGLHVADPAPSSLLLVRVERPGKITLRLPHLDLQRAQTGLCVLRLLRPRLARVVVDAGEVTDQGVTAVVDE